MFLLFVAPCCKCNLLFSELILLMMFLSMNYIFFSWETMSFILSTFMFFDKLSLYMIMMTMFICSMMILTIKMSKSIIYIILIMMNILFYLFSTTNLIIFFALFELSIIPVIFLILGWGYQPERLEALLNFFFFTTFPSSPFLIYILTNFFYNSMIFINFYSNLNTNFNMFFMYLIFLVKIPLFLLHFWLPKAHVEAPVFGSMILAGILLKMGGYGLIRFMFLSSSMIFVYIITSISILGMVMSCLMCFLSPDLKSIIAYSSVSHMNFIVAGLLSEKMISYSSSLLLMLSHALSSSGMFFLCDVLYKRSYSRSIFLNKSMKIISPMISFWWFFFCIINMSFPLTPSNLSELLISLILLKNFYFLVWLMLGLYFLLTAYYSMYIYYMVSHGSESNVMVNSLTMKENLILLCHFIPCIFMALYCFMMKM
uniref:NADH dehydrogenase subunit 4 n=1 Tax=Ciconiphilus decimfasciatus TaxID=2212705 RepID=UPI00257A49FA|nr:NADH dehydrogenase subunit 4 [Ciconiphilus decimfasciatus]WGW14994.1 NADH dehydrogenase subunit 4 [Ciconiphilus decimfasciatus]